MRKGELIFMAYQVKHQVTQSEVSERQTIKLKRLVDLLQDIEGFHIDTLKVFNDYLVANHIGIFLTYREIHIFNKLKFKDQVIIETFPYQTNAIMGYRNTLLKNDQGDVLVASFSVGPFVDIRTQGVARLPMKIVDSLDHEPRFEGMTYDDRKIKIKHLTFDLVFKMSIIKTYIDKYHHVNNSVYVHLVEHLIDDDYDYHVVRAEYKKALTLGEEAFIYRSNNHENDLTFVIKNKNEDICFVLMLLK